MATKWMNLDETVQHFKMHPLQTKLFVTGMEKLPSQTPTFILLHSGAALKGSGRKAKEEVLETIKERIEIEEANAIQARSRMAAWKSIRKRIDRETEDSQWRNPMWEIEQMKEIRRSLKTESHIGTTSRIHRKDRLGRSRYRNTLSFRDVLCCFQGQFSAFKVNKGTSAMLFGLPEEWKALYPDVDFQKRVFRWMAFPKDLSGGTKIAYLHFGNMAFRLAGNGNTIRFDWIDDQWTPGECVESWVS